MNKNIVKNSIDKYLYAKPKFTFSRKKNNFIVSKGYFNYQINIKKLSCPCSSELCEHIIYFLTSVIGIQIENLSFYNKIKKQLLLLLESNTDFSIIKEKINSFVDSELECLICYCKLNEKKFNNEIVECFTCYNYCHKYCFHLYKTKNSLFNNICIHCKSSDMI
jgi:hypothetical protein